MFQQTKQNLEKLSDVLSIYEKFILPSTINDLKIFSNELVKNIQAAQQEGRDLRIAVVGQMKAGKSSFLNALLFPVDILPKAATPMTAALTRIGYAPVRSYAEIEFYSHDDWRQISHKSHEYKQQYQEIEQQLITEQKERAKQSSPFGFGSRPRLSTSSPISPALIQSKISEELRACYELVELANNLDLKKYLGVKQRVESNDLQHLAQELTNYVGSAGKYTAITKMFSLYIHDERLKDIEIYDTPGFNDPVVSRGTQTRKFLGQCDVVFLLSAVNQFLTKSDLSLLREQLTAAGIDSKAVFVVASQRDLVFSMDRELQKSARLLAQKYPPEQRSQATIGAMNHLLDGKLSSLTHATMTRHLSDPKIDEITQKILQQVQNEPPTQISAICWRIAENLPLLPDDLREIYDGLCSNAGLQFTADNLREFSNILALRKKMKAQHARKQELLQDKVDNLYEGARLYCKQVREKAIQQVDLRLNELDSTSVEQLKRREALFKQKLNFGRRSIEQTLQIEASEIQHKVDYLVLDIKSLQQEFVKIDTLEHRDYKTEIRKKSGFWSNVARFFDIGGYETHRIEIVTPYAQVQDSIEQIESFADTALINLQKQLTTIVNMDKLRKRVANAAIDLFDTEDPDFDLLSFKTQVNQCLGMYKPPQLSFSAASFTENIVSRFGSGQVQQDDIQALKRAHTQALKEIAQQVANVAQQAKINLDQYFNNMKDNLVTNLIGQLERDLSEMAGQLQDKERSLQQLNEFKQSLLNL